MAWTNAVAALAVGGLAAYLFVRANGLARDDEGLFHFGPRTLRLRVLNYRLGGGFLALVAVAVIVAGVR